MSDHEIVVRVESWNPKKKSYDQLGYFTLDSMKSEHNWDRQEVVLDILLTPENKEVKHA